MARGIVLDDRLSQAAAQGPQRAEAEVAADHFEVDEDRAQGADLFVWFLALTQHEPRFLVAGGLAAEEVAQ